MNRSRHLYYIYIPAAVMAAVALLSLLTTGCNDRVFIEPLPEPSPVTLGADGARLTVDLGQKGAEQLSITSPYGFGSTTLYELTADGDTLGIISEASVPVPGGIAVETPGGNISVTATEAGKVKIISGECFFTSPRDFNVNVAYRQGGTVTIPVSITPIEPYTALKLTYPGLDGGSLGVTDADSHDHMGTFRVNNTGADTVVWLLKPYDNVKVAVKFTPFSNQRPIPTAVGEPLPVPTLGPAPEYRPGLYGFAAGYIPDETQTYPATTLLPDITVRVKIPPHTNRRLHIFIKRKTVSGYYTATLATPSRPDETLERNGMVYVSLPTGYLIGYNDDPQ